MLIKKPNQLNFAQVLILGLLFLASMNFIQKCFYFIFLAFFLCVLLNYRRIKVDSQFFLLCIFSVCFLVFYPYARSGMDLILKQFAYPMCYLLGLNFMQTANPDTHDSATRAKHVRTAMVVTAIGAFAHFVLNAIINIGHLNRNTIDIWTGEKMSATSQAAMAVIALGVFAAWIFSTKNKKLRIAAIVGLCVILSYNLILAGRTLLLLSAICLLVAFLYTVKNTEKRVRWKSFGIIIAIVAVFVVVYTGNIFGVRTYILGSNLSERFTTLQLSEDIRMSTRFRYLTFLIEYPFGGGKIFEEVGNYAHELYLDVYNEAGVIGWLVLIVFVVNTVIRTRRLLKKGELPTDSKVLILCVNVAIHFLFLVEPILDGMPWLFCVFCFYQGLYCREYYTMRAQQ